MGKLEKADEKKILMKLVLSEKVINFDVLRVNIDWIMLVYLVPPN